MRRCVITMLAVTLPMATTVLAHHSHTRFDLERVIAFEGAVVRYEWTNPHVYLTVEDENGAAAKVAYGQLLNPTRECITWPTPFILSSYLYLSEMAIGDPVI